MKNSPQSLMAVLQRSSLCQSFSLSLIYLAKLLCRKYLEGKNCAYCPDLLGKVGGGGNIIDKDSRGWPLGYLFSDIYLLHTVILTATKWEFLAHSLDLSAWDFTPKDKGLSAYFHGLCLKWKPNPWHFPRTPDYRNFLGQTWRPECGGGGGVVMNSRVKFKLSCIQFGNLWMEDGKRGGGREETSVNNWVQKWKL